MPKSRRNKRPPVPRAVADSAPPDPSDVTKLNPVATSALASRIRDDAAADSARRVDHVSHDDASARAAIVVGPDGIPRFTDDDDRGARETTRASAPSAALRAQAKRASSRPPGRLVRGPDGIARFVDDDADDASARETTRADVPSAELVERAKRRE